MPNRPTSAYWRLAFLVPRRDNHRAWRDPWTPRRHGLLSPQWVHSSVGCCLPLSFIEAYTEQRVRWIAFNLRGARVRRRRMRGMAR